MIATLTALLFAHVMADFVLQTDTMIRHKERPGVLLLHGALVWITAHAALGTPFDPVLTLLAAVHLGIDTIKTLGGFRSFAAFAVDQMAHMLTLVLVAALVPGLWSAGAWGAAPELLPLMAVLAGAITAITGGQYGVGLLMRPHGARIRNEGLRDGGRLIGVLERGLIFLLILAGQPLGVGFLIAAKSILRYGTATRDQRTAEYVIIGTLASFGWAIGAALITQALLSVLPPLEIRIQTP